MKNQNENVKGPIKKSKIRKYRAMLDCECMMLQGYPRDAILEHLQEDYEYAESSAMNIYYECTKRATDKLNEFMDVAKKTAISKILSISDKAYDEKRYGDSLKALDMLNKIFGNYEAQKVDVTSADEPITIKFD